MPNQYSKANQISVEKLDDYSSFDSNKGAMIAAFLKNIEEVEVQNFSSGHVIHDDIYYSRL